MRRFAQRVASLLLLCAPVLAYGQAALTMEEAVLRKGGELSPATLRQFSWRPGREDYSFVRRDTLYVMPLGGQRPTVQTPWAAVQALLQSNGYEAPARWPEYRWSGPEMLELWLGENQVFVGVDGATVRKGWALPKDADNVHQAPAGKAVAYNRGEMIEVLDARGKSYVVTADTARGIVNGRAVHRNEFGIEDGIFWSPKGNKLAFYRMDESMVHEYPLVDALAREATPEPIRYPMAGMTRHQVTIGVFAMDREGITWLATPPPADHYLTNVSWDPDGRFIYVAEINRGQDTMWLNRYDASTGALDRTVFQETSPKYVEPMVPVQFLPGDKQRFIWQSQRSGHNHLYMYDVRGKLIRPLTQGDWEVLDVHGFDVSGQNLYMTTNEFGDLRRDLVALNVMTGKRTRLTTQEGVNRSVIDPAGGRFAAFWTSFHQPGGVYAGSLAGGKVKTLLEAEDPLVGYQMPGCKLVTLTTADGRTQLYGRLFTPPDLDSTKKYPTVVYVYGGPHAQLVTDSWMGGAPYWELLMAQRGYVVFAMDNRGSANRGFAFEQPIHRQLGEVELADQLQGVKFLKALPYVDANRMGVHGWSFGGFMTINMLLRGVDAFKVGVAGGPVIDWKYYEVMYGERYMDTPQENPAGYERANMNRYVSNLAGKRLLIIHGYKDPTVVLQHSLTFFKASVDAMQPTVDAFFYTNHPHNVRGRDRVHLMQKVTDYFDTYLR